MSSLPSVQDVRRRIESLKHKPYQMLLKAIYLCGAARASEMCGAPCGSVHTRFIYGPKGTDVSLAYSNPPDLTNMEFIQILVKAIHDPKIAEQAIEELNQKIPVALFRIQIAKQELEEGEEPPFRLVALPIPIKYEPWAKELYDYFKDAGDDYVFPFKRQTVWRHITVKEPIFKGLTYRVKKYACLRTGEVGYKILPHVRALKIHGLRHVRTDELLKTYRFDGFDLAAYVGWSLGTAKTITSMPTQANTYAEIRENWQRYIKKLCIQNHDNNTS